MDAQAYVKTLEPFANNGERTAALNAASTGFIPPYNEPSCRGTVSSFDAGAGLEGVAVKSVLGAVPVVGGALGSLSGLLTGHHQQAVRAEQATLCTLVPEAIGFLQGISQLVETGQLSPSQASAALDQGFQNWRAKVKPILKDTGGKCNAACAYEKYFLAAIFYWKGQYAGRGQGIVSSGYTPGGAVGIPAAALPAAAALPLASSALPQSVLAQAGLTSSSQSNLATALLVGGVVLAGVVLLSILRR